MKIYLEIFFIVLISLLILVGCKESNTNEPQEQNYPDYYPDGIGSTFKYSVTETDSIGNHSSGRNKKYSLFRINYV